jgi:L,D-peptidoglycan transpeptidase YkuD (ErfK/YbiS/YcfS/YnhG family)
MKIMKHIDRLPAPRRMTVSFALAMTICISLLPVRAFELPADSRQCVLGIAPDWNSSRVEIRVFEKQGRDWAQTLGPWSGRLGKKGLAWGRGLHPVPPGAPAKREGDLRAPAGIFPIGGAYGYAEAIEKHPALPYHRISSRDLWVEDPASPDYNRHLRLAAEPATPWEKKQQMKQGDHAHSLKLFVAHNPAPGAIPGAGSSIFFHIWRAGGAKPSAGCTTLSEANLRQLIATIDPAKNPLYVLLPEEEYRRVEREWKLPAIELPPPTR